MKPIVLKESLHHPGPGFVHKPERPRLGDPTTGEEVIPPTRVRALRAIWSVKEAEAKGRGVPPNPVRDTLDYDDVQWCELRETVAVVWAVLEMEQQKFRRSSIDVVAGVAAVLEPFRHELGFVNSISRRVDDIIGHIKA